MAHGRKVIDKQRFEGERNEMFTGISRDWMELVDGKLVLKCCTVEDEVATLKIVDACHQSSATEGAVALAISE